MLYDNIVIRAHTPATLHNSTRRRRRPAAVRARATWSRLSVRGPRARMYNIHKNRRNTVTQCKYAASQSSDDWSPARRALKKHADRTTTTTVFFVVVTGQCYVLMSCGCCTYANALSSYNTVEITRTFVYYTVCCETRGRAVNAEPLRSTPYPASPVSPTRRRRMPPPARRSAVVVPRDFWPSRLWPSARNV